MIFNIFKHTHTDINMYTYSFISVQFLTTIMSICLYFATANSVFRLEMLN